MIELLQRWAAVSPDECVVHKIGDRHRIVLTVGDNMETLLPKGEITGACEILVRSMVEDAIAIYIQANGLSGWGMQAYSWGKVTAYSILEKGETGAVVVGDRPTEALLKLYLALLNERVEVAA